MNGLDPLNLPDRLYAVFTGSSANPLRSILGTLRSEERQGTLAGEALQRTAWIMATCHRDEYEFYCMTLTREEMNFIPETNRNNFFHVVLVSFKNKLMEARYLEKWQEDDDEDD